MSKRLRLEQERMIMVKDEEKQEEDKLKVMKERMYAAVIWNRLGTEFRVQDLKEKDFPEALNILKEYFITEDVLCKNSEMYEDEVSTKSFLDQCLFQLKDTVSIMAIDESNQEIAGVLLLRVLNRDDFSRTFSRTFLVDGVAQQKCVRIKTALNRKVNIYDKFDCTDVLRIYCVCVKPEYRRKGVGFAMMKSTLDIARSMHIRVVMGFFSCSSTQKCCMRMGMRVLDEISYVSWLDKESNLVFDDPGPGNYTFALLAGEVPAVKPPETVIKPALQQPVEVVEEKKVRLTRKERRDKRDIAAKKKHGV